MNSTGDKPARELIAELCDGLIQPVDKARLEQLLRDDAILQQEYLDQAMIDGLLRYELGVDRPSIPNQFDGDKSKSGVVRLVARPLVFVLLALTVTAGYWWFRPDSHVTFTVPLQNVSFENDQPISNLPILNGWYGDVARILLGSEDNQAHDGQRMLQLIRSVHPPSKECEIYHVVDLRQAGFKTRDSSRFIEGTVMFNALSDTSSEPYTFSMEIFTYAELPEIDQSLAPETWSSDMTTAGKKVIADSDRNSWQEVKLVMPLSPTAKFGIVKISVRDDSQSADDEFSEVFVDNVQVCMTNKGLF